MRRVLRLNKKGLTLIELLIGLALSSLVMAAIGTFLVSNITFSNIAQDEVYVQEQVRKAMRAVTNLVMEKEELSKLTNVGNNTTTAVFIKNPGKNQETLTFTYDPDQLELKYKLGTEPTTTIAKNISQFFIEVKDGEKYNHKLIEVTIEGLKNPGNQKKEVRFSLTNKVFLRN